MVIEINNKKSRKYKQKQLICFFYLMVLLPTVFAQQGIINDTRVRLRKTPGLDGAILDVLPQGLEVEILNSHDANTDEEYKWLNVIIDKKRSGWIYGQFVSLVPNKNCEESLVERYGVLLDSQVIYSGDTKAKLVSFLGEPDSIFYDDDYNEYTFTYSDDMGKVVFIIHKYNMRIHHIIVSNPRCCLVNGLRVGKKLQSYTSLNILKGSGNRYIIHTENIFKSSPYDVDVLLTIDDDGVITEIQLGLPD